MMLFAHAKSNDANSHNSICKIKDLLRTMSKTKAFDYPINWLNNSFKDKYWSVDNPRRANSKVGSNPDLRESEVFSTQADIHHPPSNISNSDSIDSTSALNNNSFTKSNFHILNSFNHQGASDSTPPTLSNLSSCNPKIDSAPNQNPLPSTPSDPSNQVNPNFVNEAIDSKLSLFRDDMLKSIAALFAQKLSPPSPGTSSLPGPSSAHFQYDTPQLGEEQPPDFREGVTSHEEVWEEEEEDAYEAPDNHSFILDDSFPVGSDRNSSAKSGGAHLLPCPIRRRLGVSPGLLQLPQLHCLNPVVLS